MNRIAKILKHWAKKLPYLRPLVEERNRLIVDVDQLRASLTHLEGRFAGLQSHAEQLRVERDGLLEDRDRLRSDVHQLGFSLMERESQCRDLREELEASRSIFADLRLQTDQLRDERDLSVTQGAQYKTWVPPGHFYSPVVSLDEIRMREAQIFGRNSRSVVGIDLREAEQLRLLQELERYYAGVDFPENKTPSHRFYFENTNFSYADAIFHYSMIRHVRPRRIVEIGSGFSSCVALDTNELYFDGSIQCTFVDPYPQLLWGLLKDGDEARISILRESVHEVDASVFLELEKNDILFIDSTHVSKTNSDVNYLLFQVLPLLNRGVYVHFHDIPFPFEYPKEWIYEGRSWNECYILRAFLHGNSGFRIELFTNFLMQVHNEVVRERMPLCLRSPGGSLWLRKVEDADQECIREMRQRPSSGELSSRVDLLHLSHLKQLGRGWYDNEQTQRWMAKRGEVRLKGPESTAQRLWVEARNTNSRPFELIVYADGISLGTAKVDTIGPIEANFPLPVELMRKETVVIALEVTDTVKVAGDSRELGLAFGVVEIR